MNETAFRENIVIITGASFGIGRQLALQLADHDAWLALAARNEEKLEELSKQCSQRGGRAIVIPTKHENGAMPADTCARIIVQAVARRKREVVMTLRGKIGLLLRRAAPGVVDRIVRKNAE